MAELRVFLTEDAPDTEYLRACARIRNISLSALVRRLVDTIADDQMVASVLDDDGGRRRYKGEHPYRSGPHK